MDVAGDWTPWESQSPIKAASKLGRGRRIGQSQYQMETYLSCVNSIYGQRSVIPYGLHSTQLVVLCMFFYRSTCFDVLDSLVN